MKRHIFLVSTLLCLAALSGCGPNRAAADQKLSNACLIALKSVYDGEDVIEVKGTTFLSEKSAEDTNLRTVRIHAYYTQNHGVTVEKDYSCSFEEISGLFGYHPKFYRLDRSDVKYGNFDGVIQGELSDMMKINQAVEPALQ